MLKRNTLIITSTLLLFLTCHGQMPSESELFNYEKNKFYTVEGRGSAKLPFLIVVIPNTIQIYPRDFNEFLRARIADSFFNDENFRIKEQRPNYLTVFSFDSSKALLFVQGINKSNAGRYEFRLLSNNQPNNNWRPITAFYPSTYISGYAENDPEMATLGYVEAPWNSYITVDVREKKGGSIISSATIRRVAHPPKVIATYAASEFNKFFTIFKVRSQNEPGGIPPDIISPKVDSLLTLRKEFSSTDNSIIFYLDDFIKKKVVEYTLQGTGKEEHWKLNELDFNFIWLKDLPPGKYKLLIRYSTQRHNVTEYDFEIRPAWQQTTWFKIVGSSLIAAFFGFIIIGVRSIVLRQKMFTVKLEREKTEVELKAIRSQLNPHFVYNCLNSIQNLINKNDLSHANKYLSQFSKMMRETLNTSDRKFNSIANEIKVLENYLGLEQLRFNFRFEIEADPSIHAETTEIPSLLLQPIVENSVKHGVASLKETGFIRIVFTREKNNLHILISDNGKGFSPIAGDGYGLKLTDDRIVLLNRTLENQSITMEKQPAREGSTILIALKNWYE